MEQFGISEAKVARLHSVFALFPEIEQVVIYGSRAKGNYSAFSDVDITLKGSMLTPTILTKLVFIIDDLLLPYEFDISIYQDIKNPDVIDHIDRVGQILYSKL
ncbi:MAG: nucleotidyltransferase domain-containing protein [Rikenellaceae bacterium]